MSRRRAPPAPTEPPPPAGPVELLVVVWAPLAGGRWRARVSGQGVAEREFVSPFEFARFIASPHGQAPPPADADAGTGLR